MEAVVVLVLGLLAWIVLLPLGLWINAVAAGRRLRALEAERASIEAHRVSLELARGELHELHERLARLERGEHAPAATPAAVVAVPDPIPAPAVPVPPTPMPAPHAPAASVLPAAEPPAPVPATPVPAALEFEAPQPEAIVPDSPDLGAAAYAPERPAQPPPPPQVSLAVSPADSLPEAPADAATTPDWESVVGASWLSKVGVLVFVVGLALFLGYSLANMGPVGRIGVGALTSLALFAGGRSLERKERYQVLGHALVGGGWSGLYFTSYAAHGLDASRIVGDPVVATIMLAIVATAMIADSLRYRVEAVTGLAFATGFATMLIAPADGFAHVALVPFSAALLAIARRLGWRTMAATGAAAAYATLLARPDAVPWSGDALSAVTAGKSSLLMLWLLFEAYSVSGIGRASGRPALVAEAWVWVTNLAGFLLVTFMHAPETTRQQRLAFFTLCAAAYLVSAAVRGLVERRDAAREAAGVDAETPWLAAATGAVGSATAAVALLTAAIVQLPVGEVHVALLVEAQVIFVAAFALRPVLLRTVASLVFSLAVLGIVAEHGHAAAADGWPVWPHVAMLAAGLLFANAEIVRRRAAAVALEPLYGYAATGLALAILAHEVRAELLGPSWLLLSVCLYALGLLAVSTGRRAGDLRAQAYGVAVLAALATGIFSGFGPPGRPWTVTWLPIGLSALAYWTLGMALAARAHDEPLARQGETRLAALSAVWIGCGLAALLVFRLHPGDLVALRFGVVAVLLVESGWLLRNAGMRLAGHLVLYLGVVAFLGELESRAFHAGVRDRVWAGVGLAGLALLVRARAGASGVERSSVEGASNRLLAWVPLGVIVMLVPLELRRWAGCLGWALFGLGFAILGRWRRAPALRIQGYLLAGLSFAYGLLLAVDGSQDAGRELLVGGAVVGVLAMMAALAPAGGGTADEPDASEAWARPTLALLATVLGGSLLQSALEARWLTLAWGLHGSVTLWLGFALRTRVLRLAGLGWLGLCTAKLFLYDLSGLETPYRILSFIVLGLLMIAVSWTYARLEARRAGAA